MSTAREIRSIAIARVDWRPIAVERGARLGDPCFQAVKSEQTYEVSRHCGARNLKGTGSGDLSDQDEKRGPSPLRPLRVLPKIADAETVDSRGGIAVEVSDLCDHAGIRYRVTGGMPPTIVLREDGGHVRGRMDNGRECFVVDVSELPSDEPNRSMRVLELLVRGFGCYQAERSICDRGYFSPDISVTYRGKVIVEEGDQ